jgi:hypothetical protein
MFHSTGIPIRGLTGLDAIKEWGPHDEGVVSHVNGERKPHVMLSEGACELMVGVCGQKCRAGCAALESAKANDDQQEGHLGAITTVRPLAFQPLMPSSKCTMVPPVAAIRFEAMPDRWPAMQCNTYRLPLAS